MLLRLAALLALAAALAIGFGLMADDSAADSFGRQDPLRWHSPDLKSWIACTTTVYVSYDGKTITPGWKSCPASFSPAKKGMLRR